MTLQSHTLPHPPTAPGLPVIGNMIPFQAAKGIPVDFMQQTLEKYGDLVHFKVMNRSIYLIGTPDLAHEILLKRVNEFHKTGVLSVKPIGLGRFLGHGILTADHAEWKPQRKLIQPLMHAKHIMQYAETMACFGEQLLSEWQDGTERDIQADMTQVTMWIIAETMFGMNITQSPAIEAAGEAAQRISVADLITPLPSWLTKGRDREAVEINDVLTQVVDDFMAERRAQGETDRHDLLTLLMNTRDENGEPMSDEFVRDNILTLFLAGHETTANTLTWAFYYLAKHPDIAEQLHREVDEVLGGRMPTLDDLPRLPYTLMVIKETMRIQPTVSVFPRTIVDDLELGGYQLTGGGVVFISPYILHHDPRWWSSPETFDPIRFSAENEPNIPKYAYLPFGGGPRVCIGNHFSLMESQILLALITSRYSLSLDPEAVIKPLRQITTSPIGGLPMRLHRR